MTKEEMLITLLSGERVSHRSFTPTEWMVQVDNLYEFEDGGIMDIRDFWSTRSDVGWRTGWSLYSN